jgi:hypothetical protein
MVSPFYLLHAFCLTQRNIQITVSTGLAIAGAAIRNAFGAP